MDDFFCNIGLKKKSSNDPTRKKRSLVVTSALWRQGQTLKIAFIEEDIDPQLKQGIIDGIMDWQPYINLRLVIVDFANDPGHIRISTVIDNRGRGWSAIGTAALSVNPNTATLNIGVALEHEDFLRTVRHEFGHALGLQHEHQHPQANISWDEPKVYDHYRLKFSAYRDELRIISPNNDDGVDLYIDEIIYENVLKKIPLEGYTANRYDKKSVMHYEFPNELTIGDWEVGKNTEISEGDKEMISLIYPNSLPSPSRC
jgi:hypothetical protein